MCLIMIRCVQAQTSGIPVNVIAFNCTECSTLDALKSISKLSGGVYVHYHKPEMLGHVES